MRSVAVAYRTLLAAVVLAVAFFGAALVTTDPVRAQEPLPLVMGTIPSTGLPILMVSRETTPEEVIVFLEENGCHAVSLSVNDGSGWHVYLPPPAPEVTRRDFPSTLTAFTGIIPRCEEYAVESPQRRPISISSAIQTAPAPVSYSCGGALVVIEEYQVPSTVTPEMQHGRVRLRYRVPRFAEATWGYLHMPTSVGDVSEETIRKYADAGPLYNDGGFSTEAAAGAFISLPVDTVTVDGKPIKYPGNGFVDGRLHVVEIAVGVYPFDAFDQGAPHHSRIPGYRHSEWAETPYRILEPWVELQFMLDGVSYHLKTNEQEACSSSS